MCGVAITSSREVFSTRIHMRSVVLTQESAEVILRFPNQWGLGDEATFTAEVDDYDRNSCLFHLYPVETHAC
jgi:hypothetical protein